LSSLVEAKLLNLAKASFNQNRSQLASQGDANHASLIGDQGAGVISNNGSGVLSDNGLGLVANNGSNIVSDHGGGYKLMALPTLPPSATIAETAQAGETLTQRRIFPDGTVSLLFGRKTAVDDEAYRLVHARDGKPFHEYSAETTELWPNGEIHLAHILGTDVYGGGNLAAHSDVKFEYDEAGAPLHASALPGSFLRDAASGAGDLIDSLELDFKTHTGTFRYLFPGLNAVETGTLSNIQISPFGEVLIPYWEPLAIYDGEETMKVDDQAVFGRKVKFAAGVPTFTYDLLDGFGLTLTPDAAVDPLAGPTLLTHLAGGLSQDGKAIATVKLDVAPEGTAVFTVTFSADPAKPLVVGYGLRGAVPSVPPPAAPEAAVTTVAGRAGKGFADGVAPLARFKAIAGLVASRKTPGRFYLADLDNHRIRVVDQGTQAVTTLAGDGTAGYADGPGATARFDGPRALAIGPDDTLYVTDRNNNRIRKVAPDGTVTSLAGGTKGNADGTGEAASFDAPSGLALDAAGNLYVADYNNAAIRRVDPQGVVTTLVAAPAITNPSGLCMGPDGFLYVADFGGDRVRKVDLTSHAVTTIAGTSDAARLGMDGAALETGLGGPRSLAFDADGRLVIANATDVRRLGADGQLRTIAGNGRRGQQDGLARNASFEALNCLALAPDGSILIGDGVRLRVLATPTP
jgi:sugar lactone lactonase YvrE